MWCVLLICWVAIDSLENLNVIVSSATSAKVTWSIAEGAEGYSVYMATDDPNGEYKCIASTANTSCTRTKMTEGTTYYFKIRTYYMVGSTKIFG